MAVIFCAGLSAQKATDSSVNVGKKIITLSELVLDNKLNVPTFINRIKNDTSFYKAFLNLRLLGYTAINDVRMLQKDGTMQASCFSKTKQIVENNCRRMETIEEQSSGDYYVDEHQYNYYTSQMYASLFFTSGSICGEDNIAAGTEFSIEGKSLAS
jgi:hypothetical protein